MAQGLPDELTPLQKAYTAIQQLRGKVDRLEQAASEAIAIIGMGCRTPGANDPDAFWELVRNGRDAIREIPAERWDASAYYDPEPGRPGKAYTRYGGFIEQADRFDAAFFGISAREAESMDPQQRLLLEVAWEALEHAGLPASRLLGSPTGVFVGVTASDYGLLQAERADQGQVNPYFNTGTPLNACAGRLSYVLGLQGPCMAVDTACSSSLTAIHLACTALRAKDCDLALSGGVNLTLSPLLNITLSAAGMMSADGRCKSFDDAANGYVRGEGCGIVILKRYADALTAGDQILALIRGSGVNQDGASSGFTVPNGVAQQKLLRQTLSKARVQAHEIDYIEAHGTGTSLGDPIEAQALGEVLGQAPGRERPLLVGSVKSNIGHLESAAGVAGLIKLVQALRHEELPPTLHIKQPNSRIGWDQLNIRPITQLTPWPRGEKRRLAGLSAFGASGSNAHLILEEAPLKETLSPAQDRPQHILALSAKTEPALNDLAVSYQRFLQQSSAPLADICFSANTGRQHFKHRIAVCAEDPSQLRQRLAAFSENQASPGLFVGGPPPAKPLRPVLMFSGQGSIYPGMGRDLYTLHPGFRLAMDDCAAILEPLLEKPLLSVLYAETNRSDNEDLLKQARYAQPALFALQYALTGLWRSFGMEPAAVFGHSIGAYAAACVAGVFSLEDGLKLVAERARLMQTLSEDGSMAAIFADEARVATAIAPHRQQLSIAAINGPQHIVVSGRSAALATLLEQFREAGIETYPLQVSHAFHSPLMEPILDPFESYARQIRFQAPKLPFISDLSGRPLASEEIPDAAYWRRHCRQPVRFAEGLNSLLPKLAVNDEDKAAPAVGRNFELFLEIGPGQVLTNLGKRLSGSATWLPSLLQQKPDWTVISTSLAEAYARGADVDWSGFDAAFGRNRVCVPTYGFQRKSYWLPPKESTMTNPQPVMSQPVQDQHARRAAILARLCQLFSGLLRTDPGEIDTHAQFLEMGADSLVLVEGVRIVEDNFGIKLEIRQFFEEITTLDAIAGYLAERSCGDLPQQAASVTTQAPQLQTPPPTPATANSAQSLSAPVPTPAIAYPATALAAGGSVDGSALQQIILAQTQLMAQQLAVLQGLPAAATVAGTPVQAVAQSSVPAQALAQTERPQASDNCSSPLRALNNPIVPGASGLSPQQSRHLESLIERYQKKTPKSKALAQACRPGLADSRASIGFRFSTKEILYPITGAESMGSRLRDIDGNRYVDLTMGFGVLLFGSRPEFMQGVLETEIQHGFQLGPRSEHMQEITELFAEITGHQRVAFTNSGTEAIMIALRLARTTTGRHKIVIFEGSYHGHSDGTLAKTTRVDGELRSEPVSPGVPPNLAKDILVLEYGTQESLNIIREHAHEIAAVLVEPVQSRRLDFQPLEFLQQLRGLTRQTGVALIFDEMISGFRAHPAGAQGLFGIKADLATYGKIIGGGMPIGAVAGDARFLDGIDGGFWQYGDASYPRATRTYFGGTFCQHPFSMAACLATLRHLKEQGPALQERLNQRTAALAKSLNDYFIAEKLELRVCHFASTFHFKFPGNLEMFYYHLLEKGVYIWEWRACFLSTAHTEEDLELLIRAVKESVAELRQGGFLPECNQAAAIATHKHLADSTDRTWFRHNSKLSHRESAFPARTASTTGRRGLAFGLFYFGNYDADFSDGKYDPLLEGARYADREGFRALWIPERHFSEFGGFSPNPSVLAAALARETQHLQLRAGSVVLPLHNPVRVAEEWALVDNLSNGRVGIGFASGWHPNDFVFAPDAYGHHRELTFEGIETIRHLWRGESITRRGGNNSQVELSIYPRPKQASLPAWLTIVNNPDTYRKAGEMGLGVLTNLMGQSLEDLADNIATYRQALAEHGHDPKAGNVTVLIHTYLCADAEQAIREARQPMCDYLLSSIGLFQKMAQDVGPSTDLERVTPEDKAYIVGKAYEKYVASSALIGSPESCVPIVEKLLSIGVDELACFVDFGVAPASVIANLPQISELKAKYPEVASGSQPGFALSEAQKQLWVLGQLDKDGHRAYNDPAAMLLQGPLNQAALRFALEQTIARHESLRTLIDATGEQQWVQAPLALSLPCIDLSAEKDPEAKLQHWLQEQTRQLFDFTQGPLFYPTLLKLGAERHVLSLSAHHIIGDGPSTGIVLNDIMAFYAAACRGETAKLATPIQYRDFIRWQQTQINSAAMAEHERYWLQQFATPLPALDLPADRQRPSVKTYNGARASSTIEASLLQALKNLGSQQGCTLYMVLLAAYSVLLHRLSGQQRLVIGAPYTGRGLEGGNALVGYCVHLLPIVSEINPASRFDQHLLQIRNTLLNAYQHQDYPFARLLDTLKLKRDNSRSPLLGSIFNLERQAEIPEVEGLQLKVYPQPRSYTSVDLTLTANLRDDQLQLECDYNTDLFDAATIQRLLGYYQTLLEAVVSQPERSLNRLPLLSEAERLMQILQWNQTEPAACPTCFHTLWEEQVAKHPDRIALVEDGPEGKLFSYDNLNRRANRLAHYLRSIGVGPDRRVGICLERSWQLMVALLASLKAGGAYLPMDPSYPAARLAFLQSDAEVAVLLTQEKLLPRLTDLPRQVCCLDRDADTINRESDSNPLNTVLPHHLAYVIYTSGSTGKPKGAMISHQGLVNYLQWAVSAYKVDQGDGAPVLGSIGFDATVTSLFVPLLAGRQVVLLPDGEELEALAALHRSPYRFSFIKLTPAHLEILNALRAADPNASAHLARYLVLGGEALPGASLDPWFRDTDTLAVNEYGPTETVVGCCTYLADRPIAGSVPIGRPIRATRLYVLDQYLQAAPPGVPGELYIGGEGLARGYLDRPGQTAAAFVPDPFSDDVGEPGARLYKTGDRARYLADGTLIFLGRIDHQIKLHGYRIELGEIEAVLTDQPNVREAVALLREDQPGHHRLVAYVTPIPDQSLDTDQLRQALKLLLPEYMVPAVIVPLTEMPLTSHGKVDRLALPVPDRSRPDRAEDFMPPGNDIERQIAAVWQEILQLDNVGIRDNFFDIGGNSLLILQAYQKLQALLPTDCLVVELFKYPTISALAAFIGNDTAPIQVDYEVIKNRVSRQKAAVDQQARRRSTTHV
ncbi:non-ribosomal peptide synthetase/type I polyketide synthase [Methylomonas albis]|uniref:Amino acid adenylation domain-containing protein n=1 Tax=Methylomonas albis TaxID=1854563 RepID=A0ABR9D516_9GAMM|nr:non-ribosomal peptide synthetase/type I polyketide synthase [Methylomonas albis]MBD9358030.1 amino acid adenylation domain-containing protein [Methylomonas albis]